MDLYCEALGVDQNKLLENCVNDNCHDTTLNQENINTTLTKNNSTYNKEMSKSTKHAYTDKGYTRKSKETLSERPKHKHQDSRRQQYDSRYRSDIFEDRQRRDDITHKRHHKRDRDEHKKSKSKSCEYKLDREIKQEPEDYAVGHSSKIYEDRSCEQSISKYRNDSKYEDRQSFHNKEYYFCSRDYDSERSERYSKPTNRSKDRYRKSEHYKYHERKRKHNNGRAQEDFSTGDDGIKREKPDCGAAQDYFKRKKY